MAGSVKDGLSQLSIGPLAHSRWLTLGCRVLRLYVSKEKPSFNLCLLANFCILVYFPCYFYIKCHPKVTDGPSNLLKIFNSITKFPNRQVREIALKTAQRNAFFAHSENVLLAMLSDTNSVQNRATAVRKIIEVRKNIKDNDKVREFKVPDVIPNAKTIAKMISMRVDDISEPPYTMNMPVYEIEAFIENPLDLAQPCHNQAVERHVKLVTEASAATSNFSRRDGMTRQKIKSRKLMPAFDTKRQFKI